MGSAADLLRPVYDESGGVDGFVSLEPPPQSTRDTAGTIREARRLWQAVNRPNLMIKVVASSDGIAAIEQLIGDGINVNITLMFSQRHYEEVAQAYLRGLARCSDPAKIASVASFSSAGSTPPLIVRWMPTDQRKHWHCGVRLRSRMQRSPTGDFARSSTVKRLQHCAVVALMFSACSWASTGVKNPSYRDVLYLEELIGPDTVNTIPPNTLEAFRQHGQVRGATVLEDVREAEEQLRRLAAFGIDLETIADRLQVDGIAAFAKAYDQVLAALGKKTSAIAAGNH